MAGGYVSAADAILAAAKGPADGSYRRRRMDTVAVRGLWAMVPRPEVSS